MWLCIMFVLSNNIFDRAIRVMVTLKNVFSYLIKGIRRQRGRFLSTVKSKYAYSYG